MKNKLQFITLFISLIAIAVPTYVAYDLSGADNEKAAKLEYEIKLAPTDISDLFLRLGDRIKLYAEGVKITNLHIAAYLLKNNGGAPILPKDIYENISITAPVGWKIHGISNVNDAPGDANLVWKRVSENRYSLQPLLINPGDSFAIIVYSIPNDAKSLTGQEKSYTWSARIANVAPIAEYVPQSITMQIKGPVIVLLSGWGLLFTIFVGPILLGLIIFLSGKANLLPQLDANKAC
ncbi:hypothetical protein DSCO28_02960 [Desulfosarcina ovata subsp. sediminis]|uniref:Uncharacterized protein n=1 Tax=Desulfosarcina ovata subsp. sediminis TaxID=885957 RepID=A0A5K7ZML9_9BACT|nr:hypothetical protein [Desulfosarcina ovata]BBO79730.1 hypothetical protein DSCO28_02960 [Desulfosarcina ovata subsp. sediminis]